MACSLNIPWHRYALVADLARRLENKSPTFGKSTLQKLVYILQVAFGVKCGYSFQLQTYGPYTSQLLADLDLVEHFRAVRVSYVSRSEGNFDYRITAAERNDVIRAKGAPFLDQSRSSIDKLVEEFGDLSPKDLDLRAMIIRADRDARRSGDTLTRDEFIALVKGVRPKRSEGTISEALSELERNGHVTAR